MSEFKLVTYQSPHGPRAGLVVGETIFDIAAATGRAAYVTMLDVLRDWAGCARPLRDAAGAPAGKSDGLPLRGTKLLAPVRLPAASSAPAPISPTT